MKRKTTALFSILAVMLFLAACATTGSGPGAVKRAILTVPDCLEWTITAETVRGIARSVDGVQTVAVDPASASLTISYDPQKTSPAKVAQVIREKGFQVSAIKLLD